VGPAWPILPWVTVVGSALGRDGLGLLKAGRPGRGQRSRYASGWRRAPPWSGRRAAGQQAVGGVVGAAAALQSAARPGSVLVGAATRATEGILEWGPILNVPLSPGTEQLRATYLVQYTRQIVCQSGSRHDNVTLPPQEAADRLAIRKLIDDRTETRPSAL